MIKKILLLFFALMLVFVISSWVVAKKVHLLSPEEVKQKVKELSNNEVTFVKQVKTNDSNWYAYLYHVKMGNVKQPFVIFVSTDGNIVFGRVFTKKGAVIPTLSQEDMMPKFENVDVSKFSQQDRIVINSQGKHTMFMFYSPECPHCKRAMSELANYRGKYKIIVKFMVPPEKMESAKAELGEWLHKQKGISKEEADKLAVKMIQEDFNEGIQAGVMGTPMFFDEKGKYYPMVPDVNVK